MNTPKSTKVNWISITFAFLVIVLAIVLSWNIVSTSSIGWGDFAGYWSSTYLLHNGQNPYSSELMQAVQRNELQSPLDFTILTWNPPTLYVFLLPLAWVPFTVAKFIWLIVNLLLIITAGLMLISIYLPHGSSREKLLFLLFTISFPAVTTAFYMGQVTLLGFWGLVTCLVLIRKEKWFLAGAVLILTSVKPHMAILAVIYLLIYMAYKRKYTGWVGLATASIIFLIILLGFRPNLLFDFQAATTVVHVKWATSTIGGFLSYLGITEAARYLILLLLPLPFILANYPETFSLELSVALLTLITVPTTVFGWGYDQAILLIPIAQVFGWLIRSKYKHLISVCILGALIFNYYQRSLIINETYYVWIPLFWWLIFAVMWREILMIKKDYA